MDHNNPLPALTQDEVRVGAWAEVREPLELQLAPLGRRALAALAPRPGESVLDIGCGGGETALDLARAVAPDGTVVGVDLSAAVLAFARRAAKARRPRGASCSSKGSRTAAHAPTRTSSWVSAGSGLF